MPGLTAGASPYVAALIKKVPLEGPRSHAILWQMVTYRVVERRVRVFVVEAYREDYRSWRHIDEFPTREEAEARKCRLEQILQASQEEAV
jgi:hypothetical protein